MAKRIMPKKQAEGWASPSPVPVLLVALIVVTLIVMVAQQGLSAFLVDGINFGQFIPAPAGCPRMV